MSGRTYSLLVAAALAVFLSHLLSHHVHLSIFAPVARLAELSGQFSVFAICVIACFIAGSLDDSVNRLLRRSHVVALAFIIAGCLSVAFCRTVRCGKCPTGSFAMDFDPSRWAQAQLGGSKVADRQKMLGDVVNNVIADSTREQIQSALGPTEDASWLDESGGDILSYYTGPARDSFIPIDGEVLVIRFDENDRVADWYTFID